MSVSDELDQWIEKYGSGRDALNVALAQLDTARHKLNALFGITFYKDCPNCDGVILPSYVCLNCGCDLSIEE